jgi:hypothetical protein
MQRKALFWALLLIEGLHIFTGESPGGLAPQPLVQGKVLARVPGLKSSEM